MRANFADTTVNRLFEVALQRVKDKRVSPSPNSTLRGDYRCAFSNTSFLSSNGLNSENVMFILNTDTRDASVWVVSPMILRRIREFLVYEGEYVVLHNSMMQRSLFHTWTHILEMSYTVRGLNDDSKYVFDLREWVGDVKIALTGDWSSDAVHEVKNGRLDVDYAADILTTLFDVKPVPICLYYVACYVPPISRSYRDAFGFLLTPDKNAADQYEGKFNNRYGRFGGASTLVEQGELRYSSTREMYETLRPRLSEIWRLQDQNVALDFGVSTGLKIFNCGYDRFLFRWENGG